VGSSPQPLIVRARRRDVAPLFALLLVGLPLGIYVFVTVKPGPVLKVIGIIGAVGALDLLLIYGRIIIGRTPVLRVDEWGFSFWFPVGLVTERVPWSEIESVGWAVEKPRIVRIGIRDVDSPLMRLRRRHRRWAREHRRLSISLLYTEAEAVDLLPLIAEQGRAAGVELNWTQDAFSLVRAATRT
jgi:hypothetical protein